MIRHILTLALLANAPAWAAAQAQVDGTGPNPVPAESPQQSLYQEALQALGEGRRSDASTALQNLIDREPRHAGAWLDLALIQCSLGHADEAERLFATVETRFSPSRDILELIAQARETGCRPPKPASAASVSLSRGFDDNVNQGASNSTLIVTGPDGQVELPLLNDFLPKRDQYTSLAANYVRNIGENNSLATLQFQQRRYDTLHSYDTAALYAGIESPYRIRNWALRLMGTLGVSMLGEHLYQKQVQLQTRVTPPLSLPTSTQLHVVGGVTVTEYPMLDAFNSNVYELRALLSHQHGSLMFSTAFGMLSDRARNDRPGGNRHGDYFSLSLRRPFAWNTAGELGYTRQGWNSASPYAPGLLIDQVRAQRTEMLHAAFSWQVGKYQSVVLGGRVVRNRENISIFQYNNRQLQLSWQWQYP